MRANVTIHSWRTNCNYDYYRDFYVVAFKEDLSSISPVDNFVSYYFTIPGATCEIQTLTTFIFRLKENERKHLTDLV